MKKFIYADTFSINSFHEVFNASSLKMFSEIFGDITYYASKSSYKATISLLLKFPDNIKYHPIFLVTPESSLGNAICHLLSSLWNILILLIAPKSSIVFFNYNSLWGIKWMNRICKYRSLKVIIMCHGELEYITTKTPLNFFSRKALSLFISSNFIPANNLFFCVAGESILKNIRSLVAPQLRHKFISFEHTFIAHNKENTKAKSKRTIKIGTIGTVRALKGLDNILQIGNLLKNNPNIEFYALGRINCDVRLLNQSCVKYIPGSEKDFVSKETLNQYIDDMDCVIFTYPQKLYKLTASGALFDAIDSEKIILSLHNDYFNWIFSRANIGYLFESVEEMANFILKADFEHLKETNDKDYKYILSPEYEAIVCKDKFINLQ